VSRSPIEFEYIGRATTKRKVHEALKPDRARPNGQLRRLRGSLDHVEFATAEWVDWQKIQPQPHLPYLCDIALIEMESPDYALLSDPITVFFSTSKSPDAPGRFTSSGL
jgi:hypothetical protein